MSLTDAQVERYSRQIILPEVGGRGQERLLAARVAIGGGGPSADAAALLLGRAGIGTVELIGPGGSLDPHSAVDLVLGLYDSIPVDDDTSIDGRPARSPFVFGAREDSRILVATLIGRPCVACFGHHPSEGSGDGGRGDLLAAPASLALGSLAAIEALRVLLSPPDRGRLTRLELDRALATATDLDPTEGCILCGTNA
jgi:hypothetical protein